MKYRILLACLSILATVDAQLTTSVSEIDYSEGFLLDPFAEDNDTSSSKFDYFDKITFDDIDDLDDNTKAELKQKNRVTMVIPPPSVKVKEIEAHHMKIIENPNGSPVNDNTPYTSLTRILNFYNSELLIENWNDVRTFLNPICRNDVNTFLRGLKNGESWALKLEDSNGRYTNGFFWGNNYWTGSQTLCLKSAPSSSSVRVPVATSFSPSQKPEKLIQNQDIISNFTSQNASDMHIYRTKRNSEISSQYTAIKMNSPSLTTGYQHGKLNYDSLPPFLPSFYVLRVHLNSSTKITPNPRTIFMGLCMPDTCQDEEIKIIVEKISQKNKHVSVQISDIKSQHRWFNIWEDQTFKILFVTSAIVGILIVVGTSYDIYLKHNEKLTNQKALNIASFNMTKEEQPSKHISLDLGKSGMYIVNNNSDSADDNIQETSQSEECLTTKGIFSELLLSFSARINLKTICEKSVGSDTIPTIHGLRSISMAWVILGHTCIIAFKYSDNMEYRKVVEKEFIFQTVTNGTFSVDTFFFISGLLVTFIYCRTAAKGTVDHLTKGANKFQAGILHFLGLVGYRFARLTIPYMFVIGVVEVVMKWYHYNSVFEAPTMDHVNCPNYWWRNILYINTLFPNKDMCMLWSWYLADDTQFYIIGIIILIIGLSYFKTASIIMVTLLLSSLATTAYVAVINKHMPNLDDPLALFDQIYDKPWTRIGPYFVGMSTGYILYKTNCQIKMSKLLIFFGWFMSSVCLLSLIYGLYEVNLTPITAAAYSSLSHTVWTLGLAWIVIACSTGYGGPINTLLSAPILYPFSRVTYCAYLIHPLSIRFMIMRMDTPLHLGTEVILTIYFGQIVLSYLLSFLLSVVFEAPVVSMLRILNPKGRKTH